MTCNPTLWYVIPEATARAAQRAFPKGNRSMTMYETLGPLFTNPDFADLSAHRGRPAEAPARLALVLIVMSASIGGCWTAPATPSWFPPYHVPRCG